MNETLLNAGYKSLRDILDLERSDVMNIKGMHPEHADVLMGFLSEVTEESDGATAVESADQTAPAIGDEASETAEKPEAAEAAADEEPEAAEEAAAPAAVADEGVSSEDESAADSPEEAGTEPNPTPTT